MEYKNETSLALHPVGIIILHNWINPIKYFYKTLLLIIYSSKYCKTWIFYSTFILPLNNEYLLAVTSLTDNLGKFQTNS
jgi:hypothetical protein